MKIFGSNVNYLNLLIVLLFLFKWNFPPGKELVHVPDGKMPNFIQNSENLSL